MYCPVLVCIGVACIYHSSFFLCCLADCHTLNTAYITPVVQCFFGAFFDTKALWIFHRCIKRAICRVDCFVISFADTFHNRFGCEIFIRKCFVVCRCFVICRIAFCTVFICPAARCACHCRSISAVFVMCVCARHFFRCRNISAVFSVQYSTIFIGFCTFTLYFFYCSSIAAAFIVCVSTQNLIHRGNIATFFIMNVVCAHCGVLFLCIGRNRLQR